jgi:hypothetical protein
MEKGFVAFQSEFGASLLAWIQGTQAVDKSKFRTVREQPQGSLQWIH